MRYETDAEIHAPAEQVWAVLHDVARWPEWSPTMDEVRRLDEGAFAVGSRARVKQPKMNAMVWQVTDAEPGRSFVWCTTGAGFAIAAGHHLTPADGGRTGVRLTIEMTGPLGRVLWPLTGAKIRRYVDLECASLKRYCEGRTSGIGT